MASTAMRSASIRPASQSTCNSPRPLTAWMRCSSRSMSGWILMVASSSFTLCRFRFSCPCVFLSVEREYDPGILQHRLDVDGTLPELEQVCERVLGVVRLQFDT